MTSRLPRTAGSLLIAVSVVLPLILVLSALRTLRELDEQREVYLRSRTASIAARLETIPPQTDMARELEAMKDDEAGLVEVAILERDSPESAGLEDLWEGRALFRTTTAPAGGVEVMRSWVPFHMRDGLRVARIDVARDSADFLLVHGRHNVMVATLGGLVLVGLALVAFWTLRRAAALEQKQLEMEHLARIGQMSAVLAHEIRNPLGTIKGFAQLIAEKLQGGDRALVEPVIAESTRLEQLVNDLLLYGRPPKPEIRQTDSAAIRDLLEAHAGRFVEGKGVRLSFDVPGVTFETDPNLLQQVLLNLMRNAVEAAEGTPGAEVRISLEAAESGSISWQVADNGPGLPAELRGRLYEPFATTKSSGSGLGLAISKKLAEALSGRLVVSDGPGGGTVARVVLPAGD